MTDATTRLAEIAAKFQTDDWLGTEAGEAINHLIGTLTAAQDRSREDAEIMREAIAQLDFNTEGVHTINGIPSTECWRCKSPTKLPAERLTHTPDCIITKLRARADELEGRT